MSTIHSLDQTFVDAVASIPKRITLEFVEKVLTIASPIFVAFLCLKDVVMCVRLWTVGASLPRSIRKHEVKVLLTQALEQPHIDDNKVLALLGNVSADTKTIAFLVDLAKKVPVEKKNLAESMLAKAASLLPLHTTFKSMKDRIDIARGYREVLGAKVPAETLLKKAFIEVHPMGLRGISLLSLIIKEYKALSNQEEVESVLTYAVSRVRGDSLGNVLALATLALSSQDTDLLKEASIVAGKLNEDEIHEASLAIASAYQELGKNSDAVAALSRMKPLELTLEQGIALATLYRKIGKKKEADEILTIAKKEMREKLTILRNNHAQEGGDEEGLLYLVGDLHFDGEKAFVKDLILDWCKRNSAQGTAQDKIFTLSRGASYLHIYGNHKEATELLDQAYQLLPQVSLLIKEHLIKTYLKINCQKGLEILANYRSELTSTQMKTHLFWLGTVGSLVYFFPTPLVALGCACRIAYNLI